LLEQCESAAVHRQIGHLLLADDVADVRLLGLNVGSGSHNLDGLRGVTDLEHKVDCELVGDIELNARMRRLLEPG